MMCVRGEEMFRVSSKKKKKALCSIPEFIHTMKESSDFVSYNVVDDGTLCLFYYKSTAESLLINRFILTPIKRELDHIENISDIANIVTLEEIITGPTIDDIREKLLSGYVLIQLKNDSHSAEYALIRAESSVLGTRLYNDTENEYSVIGPKVGFVENIDTNIHLLRRNIVTEQLVFKEVIVGSISKTKVVVAYIEGITNDQHVNTAMQRLQGIDFDVPFDATMIEQFISDNSNSPFPVLLPTERLDRSVYALINGGVVILTDGSPYALAGPATLLDFFVSPEDYYLPWIAGSFLRLVRFFGAAFSLFSSAIYTAVLTYHYQMIPADLLGPIIFSRANVPFPPILEALFLEITIELLREAGARLPTKVGQTIGIVGGIVCPSICSGCFNEYHFINCSCFISTRFFYNTNCKNVFYYPDTTISTYSFSWCIWGLRSHCRIRIHISSFNSLKITWITLFITFISISRFRDSRGAPSPAI